MPKIQNILLRGINMKKPQQKLTENMTLREYQKYIKDLEAINGWDKDTYATKFVLFMEEVGELAKAMRKQEGLYTEKAKNDKNTRLNLEEEFADVLNYFMDLANKYEVDVITACIRKDKENEKRTWD